LTQELTSAQRVVTNFELTTYAQTRELAQHKKSHPAEITKHQRAAIQDAAKIQQLSDQVSFLQQKITELHDDSSSSSSSDDDNMASTELSKN